MTRKSLYTTYKKYGTNKKLKEAMLGMPLCITISTIYKIKLSPYIKHVFMHVGLTGTYLYMEMGTNNP